MLEPLEMLIQCWDPSLVAHPIKTSEEASCASLRFVFRNDDDAGKACESHDSKRDPTMPASSLFTACLFKSIMILLYILPSRHSHLPSQGSYGSIQTCIHTSHYRIHNIAMKAISQTWSLNQLVRDLLTAMTIDVSLKLPGNYHPSELEHKATTNLPSSHPTTYVHTANRPIRFPL